MREARGEARSLEGLAACATGQGASLSHTSPTSRWDAAECPLAEAADE